MVMADFSNSNVDSVRESSAEQEEGTVDLKLIIVGQRNRKNEDLAESIETLGFPAEFADTGLEYFSEAGEYDTVFVLDKFEGEVFNKLHRAGARIVGPPVLIKSAREGLRIPSNTRPLYCQMMNKLILCFTGFKIKEDLSRLADLVHYMGGSIRKDFNPRCTHLVANCTNGEKYRVAVSLGTPIMNEDWIHKMWDSRDNMDVTATDESLLATRMKPFFYSTLSFLGFTKEETRHMEQITIDNGGTVAEAGSPTCTHLVVDEHSVKSIPFDVHPKLHTVKSEWYWASIQMDACADESMYRFAEVQETPTVNSKKSNTTPKSLDSGSKSRKRKRREVLAQLAAEGEPDSPVYGAKRKSNEVARMSFSASFLDATADTSSTPAELAEKREQVVSPTPGAKLTARQQTVMELLQTEKNYVGILNTLIHVFRDEIERSDQPGGPLLGSLEVNLIFGKIPPILEAHAKLRDDLQELVTNWREDRSIGAIVARHVDALTRAYPPFVNFFEQSKLTIDQCDRTKPRFHAFLKVCQTKAECGRQTLTELLIRPVQRLPSVLLLLKDILKRTDRSNLDHPALEQAICGLETVMTHVNEDKRKTEGHQVMFDIVNDIDNVPPNLLSSHRAFVGKTDAVEVTDTLSGKGDHVSLFLFSDSLELCKRRLKILNAKSPAAHGVATPKKAYKHLDMLPLSCIKKVLNIVSTECRNVFGLITKKIGEVEKLYAFVLEDEDANKDEFLQTLCRHIANTTCRADYENLLTTVDAQYLKVDASDLMNKTLSKAATRFGKRVSRAFSFNKTPRKLKRAMSSMTQMMSPFRRDSFAAPPHGFTPHRNDSRMPMRLASTNDLTEDVVMPDHETFSDTYYSDLLDSVSVTSQSSINLREAVQRGEHAQTELMGPPPLPDRRLTLTPGASLPFSPPARGDCGRPSRRETLAGIPSFSSIVSNIRPGKRLRSPCTPKTTSMISSNRLPQLQENESPILTMPSTPNLSSHLAKSATIGHSASMKFL